MLNCTWYSRWHLVLHVHNLGTPSLSHLLWAVTIVEFLEISRSRMGSGTMMAGISKKAITNDIADEATKCAQKFELVAHHIQALELNSLSELEKADDTAGRLGADSNDLNISSELLKDTWARFNIWTSNIGALQRGRASLDYRLRHADVKEEVLRLLKHLNSTLSHNVSCFKTRCYISTTEHECESSIY